jgi:hypothetical protein
MVPNQVFPVAVSKVNVIGTVKSQKLLQIHLDSGSTVSMIKRSTIPVGAIIKEIGKNKN